MGKREEDRKTPKIEHIDRQENSSNDGLRRNAPGAIPWMADKIEIVPPEIIRWPRVSPRKAVRRQHEALKRSLCEFGFVTPILIDSDHTLVAGHALLRAALDLKLANVPVVRLRHLTDTQIRALGIALNRIAEIGAWDQDVLARELEELAGLEIDFRAIGFTTTEVDLRIEGTLPKLHEMALDDTPPTQRDKLAISKLGDLWNLGLHKVLCGDSLDPATIPRLLVGILIACVLSDVPYNLAVKSFSGRGRIKHAEFAMASGEMNEEEFLSFLKRYLTLSIERCANGTLLYIFIDWRHLEVLLQAGRECDLSLINVVTWVKTNPGMGSFYRSQSEFVVVFKHGDAPHTNNIDLGRYGRNRSNVWTYEGANSINPARRKELALHPTVKPARLCADAILDCTARGDIIFDGFLGSGTTLIAAEDVGRICYGIEIDPWYVDTIIRRWQEFTGLEAINEATGRTFRETEQGQTMRFLPAPNTHKGSSDNV